jgi:hypothetical protein
MRNVRVMDGLEDLEGRRVGTLRVGRMVSRRPAPRYTVKCDQCGAESTESQSRIQSGAARCMSSSHGNTTTKRGRDLLGEQRQQIAERENQRRAEELAASAARMEFEADGHTPPLSFAEQQARILRERRDQEARAEREATEAPRRKAEQQRIAELQAEQERTLRQLHAIERERVANGTDDEFTVDPATVGKSNAVAPEKVAAWQQAQFSEFLQNNPGYYKCDANAKILTDYFERNVPGGLPLLSAAQLSAAYKRLNEFGLLKAKPAPAPAKPKLVPEFMLDYEPAKTPSKPEPVMFDGWDLETGEPRVYSEKEIQRMSSTQMAHALQMRARGEMELPRIGPGPLTRKQKGEV